MYGHPETLSPDPTGLKANYHQGLRFWKRELVLHCSWMRTDLEGP